MPTPARFEVVALDGVPEVEPGDDLADMLLTAYAPHGPADGDILVVTSKIVSKAEGRILDAESREAAIDSETVRDVARVDHAGGGTRIVENRQGLVLAAAGVDASNVAAGRILLLPVDPDASALRLARALRAATGRQVGVIISDTLGRAWRVGQTDHAIGAAGVVVAADLRGTTDTQGRVLEATIAALADELAAAADLVKGKASGRPVALIRGLGELVGAIDGPDALPGARSLQRPAAQDLFRQGSAEAWRAGYEAALGIFPPASDAEESWQVIVPVKPAALAKSRLAVAVAPELRESLARAIALDTIEAAAHSALVHRVIVVTSDPETTVLASALDHVEVAPDTADGLGPAIGLGLAVADRTLRRAVLLGDLPALDPVELEHALRLAERAGRAFVADAEDTGTVLATAKPGIDFEPLFGPDSARRHAAAGFVPLRLPATWGLRRDVDEPAHLEELRTAGRLGPRTTALLGGA